MRRERLRLLQVGRVSGVRHADEAAVGDPAVEQLGALLEGPGVLLADQHERGAADCGEPPDTVFGRGGLRHRAVD
jgi:hypothetical protein